MKKIIGIALVLALALGIAAFAETTDPVPAVTEEAATPTEDNADSTPEDVDKVEDTNVALQDALDAYRKAKEDKRVSDFEEELSEYVASGSLTQEQADLILNSVKERQAAKNGECPNCGYQFSKGSMKGQQRGGMQRDGKMGGMQRSDAQSGATPQQGGMQMPGNQIPGIVPQM